MKYNTKTTPFKKGELGEQNNKRHILLFNDDYNIEKHKCILWSLNFSMVEKNAKSSIMCLHVDIGRDYNLGEFKFSKQSEIRKQFDTRKDLGNTTTIVKHGSFIMLFKKNNYQVLLVKAKVGNWTIEHLIWSRKLNPLKILLQVLGYISHVHVPICKDN